MQDAESQLKQLLSVCLTLRPDVSASLHESGGRPYYQVHDPLTSRYFRMGLREWNFARQLDGTKSLAQLIVASNAASEESGSRDQVLTPQDAISLGRWLVQSQLARSEKTSHPMFARAPRTGAKIPAWLNPAFIRIPLFNPDALLSKLGPFFYWTISPFAFVIWCLVGLMALSEIAVQWDRFSKPLATILAPDNWLYLLVVWIVLKVVHEFYHGLACKKYGGTVPTCGLMFILFSPMAFVDVTSSWKFRSKWHRIFTAAAGMYVELFLAALATLVWARSGDMLVEQICYNIITMAGISTLLFNGNFLMRFDGYYIVSDLLGLQNLYTGGQQYMRYLFRRYLLGVATKDPVTTAGIQGLAIRLYGPASLVWRISFYIGILFTATTMFAGAGIVISVIIGVLWLLLPTLKFLKYLVLDRGKEQPNRIRFAMITGSLLALLAALWFCPWPGGIVASGVVEYEPLQLVRAESPGFLRAWHVSPGQIVQAGDLLADLENDETRYELKDVQFELAKSEIRLRMFQQEEEYADRQVELEHFESLKTKERELTEKADSLKLRAPGTGRVIGRDLLSMNGRYLDSGETILAIGDEDTKSILVSVAQQDADFFLRQVGVAAHVRIKGRSLKLRGARLAKVNPRATKELTHGGLAAPNGGPLPVMMADDASGDDGEVSGLELVEPHFLATVELSPEQSRALKAGELARVRLFAKGETIGAHVTNTVRQWVAHQLGQR